jgi:hypothetical protein
MGTFHSDFRPYKRFVPVILILFLSQAFSAQEKKVKGTYTDLNDAVHNVTMNVSTTVENLVDWFFLQERIRYIDSTGESANLIPERAKEIRFTYDDVRYKMAAVKFKYIDTYFGTDVNKELFAKIELDGPCRAFAVYMQDNPDNDMVDDFTLIRKNSQYYFFRGNKPEKTNGKKVEDFFADCPELVQKIKKIEMDRNHGESLARFYNTYCVQSAPAESGK